jgi:hypothetical protein
MVPAIYDAFVAAGMPDDKASRAAEILTDYDQRFVIPEIIANGRPSAQASQESPTPSTTPSKPSCSLAQSFPRAATDAALSKTRRR